MILKQFDNDGYTKYVCKHELGLNWSKLAIIILAELFEFEMFKQDIKDDMFSFDLKQNNHHVIPPEQEGIQ